MRPMWILAAGGLLLAALACPAAGATAVGRQVAFLKSDDIWTQCRAADALGAMGPAAREAIPALIEAVNQDGLFLRRHASVALGKIGPEAIRQLVATLRPRPNITRTDTRALWALGKIGKPAAPHAPAIVAAMARYGPDAQWGEWTLVRIGPAVARPVSSWLKHEHHLRRTFAALVLLRLGPGARPAMPELTDTLKDSHMGPRMLAVESLGNIGPPAAGTTARIVWCAEHRDRTSERREALEAVPKFGKAAIPYLVQVIKADQRKDRRAGELAEKLLQGHGADAVPALVELLESDLPHAHRGAALAVVKIGAPAARAAPALIRLAKDWRSRATREAVTALGSIGPAHADVVPALTRLATSENHMNQSAAIMALANMWQEGGVLALLIRTASDRNDQARSAAFDALARVGPPARAAVPAVAKELRAKRWTDRARAVRTLIAIDRPAGLKRGIPVLVEGLLNEEKPGVADVLARLGAEARPAVPGLLKALEHKSPYLRHAAAQALLQIAPRQAERRVVPILIEMVKTPPEDRSSMVNEAAEALAALGPRAKPAVPELQAALARQRRVHALFNALVRIDPPAKKHVPALIHALRNGVRGVRYSATDELAAVGPDAAAAVPALIEMMKNRSHNSYQREACKVLGAIGPGARDAVPALIPDVKQAQPDRTLNATVALGRIGPAAAAAVPALLKRLADPHCSFRYKTAIALGRIGPAAKGAVPLLTQLLQSEGPLTRAAAAEALGLLGPLAKTTVPDLEETLHDEFPEPRDAAKKALRLIRHGK